MIDIAELLNREAERFLTEPIFRKSRGVVDDKGRFLPNLGETRGSSQYGPLLTFKEAHLPWAKQ